MCRCVCAALDCPPHHSRAQFEACRYLTSQRALTVWAIQGHVKHAGSLWEIKREIPLPVWPYCLHPSPDQRNSDCSVQFHELLLCVLLLLPLVSACLSADLFFSFHSSHDFVLVKRSIAGPAILQPCTVRTAMCSLHLLYVSTLSIPVVSRVHVHCCRAAGLSPVQLLAHCPYSCKSRLSHVTIPLACIPGWSMSY